MEAEKQRSIPQQCYDGHSMVENFKFMVKNIAQDVDDRSTQSLMYLCNMNSAGSERDKTTALDVLWKLEKKGTFSHDNIGPLETLLKRIDRCDLVTKHIDAYKQKYGSSTVPQHRQRRPYSAQPTCMRPRLSACVHKPRSKTDPPVKIFHTPAEETGTERNVCTTVATSSGQVPYPVQEVQKGLEQQQKLEANTSYCTSHSKTPSKFCGQSLPQGTRPMTGLARCVTGMSTPIRAQKNSRPSNTSMDSELLEQLTHMDVRSSASSMTSLPITTPSSSDLEDWQWSEFDYYDSGMDEQETVSFCESNVVDSERRSWVSRERFLLSRKKMAKKIALHDASHYKHGMPLTSTILMQQNVPRGIKMMFQVFPYGLDADLQSHHATLLVQTSPYRQSGQEIAENCYCFVNVKVTFTNSLTQEILSIKEGRAELNPTSCEACIQISQALSHSDILYGSSDILMLVVAELVCQDKVVGTPSDDQDCPGYLVLSYTPDKQF